MQRRLWNDDPGPEPDMRDRTALDRAIDLVPAYTEQRLGFGAGPINTRGGRNTSQNWVVVSMFAAIGANRLSVDFDAAWLGNGCSPAEPAGEQIAPVNQRFGPLVCPVNTPTTNCGVGTAPPFVNP